METQFVIVASEIPKERARSGYISLLTVHGIVPIPGWKAARYAAVATREMCPPRLPPGHDCGLQTWLASEAHVAAAAPADGPVAFPATQ